MFLTPIDFATMYGEHKRCSTFQKKDSSSWDSKSADMAPRMIRSKYVDDFISKMSVDSDDVILDIGCGPGTLAIPLAKMAKKVIAIDFSPKMLEVLENYAREEGVTNIETHCLCWDDDWVIDDEIDIVVASRSMEVDDMRFTLEKISKIAKKSCYVTYKAGGSFVDSEILDFIGKKIQSKPDFWYLPLMLYEMGYLPRVDYIEVPNGSVRDKSKDEFINSLIWSVHHLDDNQIELAKEYYDSVIVAQNRPIKPTNWAFISWNTAK